MNVFGYILVIITILITVFIGVKQPQMHNRVVIYDSQYTLKKENPPEPQEEIVMERNIPTAPTEKVYRQESQVYEKNNKMNSEPQKVQKTTQPQKVVQIKQNPVEVKKQPANQTAQKSFPQTKSKNENMTPQKQPVIVQTQSQPVSQPAETVKIMTPQEEVIAWNKWRADLQNQILKDVKLPIIPKGTIFRVSFDVDVNGRVSNIQTEAIPSQYTPYAIEYGAPVIKSYQGKSILDFPTGSNRTRTTFTGRWKISENAKFSSPEIYNDIERVVK